MTPTTEKFSATGATLGESLRNIKTLLAGPASPIYVEGLKGSSRALFLPHLLNEISRPIVILTPDQNTGEALLGDIRFFVRHQKLKGKPHFFPSWELLPYETLSPLPEVSGERLDILHKLMNGECDFLVVPVEAALQYVMPRSVLKNSVFSIHKGESIEKELVETCLVDNGFAWVDLVEERGQFSSRGDVLDLYVPGHLDPVRLEFFGDEVESIRRFDISSQVSIKDEQEVSILPVREIPMTPEAKERGIENILAFGKEQAIPGKCLQEVVEQIQTLDNFSGLELLAPFFYSEKESLFDYLPTDTLILLDEEELVFAKGKQFDEMVQDEYERSLERENLAPPPQQLYLDLHGFQSQLNEKSCLNLNTLKLNHNGQGNAVHFEIKSTPMLRGQFDAFTDYVEKSRKDGYAVTVVAPTKGQVKRIHELLSDKPMDLEVDTGFIQGGFEFPDLKHIFVAEHEIFGRSHKHRYRRKPKSLSFQRGLQDLSKGDYLVHIDYGIGQYLGVRELETGVGSGEFLDILYLDNEKLYIPMDGLACIQKYIGSGEASPSLDKLGGVSWKRQKKKVKEALREMAEELLKLYAAREISKGVAYSTNPVLMQEFADSFEYVETEDQFNAIEEVYQNLEEEKPMDRLVCGDVGFGKTEVAMRAAFKVVLDKKQVAVLVPTTILAQQHLNTFQERFRHYPVNIDMVSRFRSPREQKKTLEKLKQGQVNIVIGTHRLLSKDVKFADLGLIIIDEEQRFGVRHKEKLKKLRATVDILTLTATPIPRTLHFSLMGIRDLSVIETPPSDRLAIKTYVRKFDEAVIRESILRELDRGGQIYFVHNKVKSIHSMAQLVQNILPQVKIGVAHGQMPEKSLEDVMKKFIDHEIDLLMCTSIIESGLDIPAANTIIINRADQFGLAQLYQLRGRVGRYKHQAFAYLMIPGIMAITPEARKRIAAIEELSELGAGFQLAARDMEIRGTGNLLGHNQSGHINAIGFDLYCKLIEDTVKEIKGEKVEAKIEPEIDLQTKGFIPREYIPDLNQRLEMYRRLHLMSDLEGMKAIEEEMADRFGRPPEPVEKLFLLLEIKILCQKLHISKARIQKGEVKLTLEHSTPIDTENMMRWLDKNMRLVSEYQISIKTAQKGWQSDLQNLKHYLRKLLEPDHAV